MSDSSIQPSYAYLLHKAWPIILANAAVPTLGLVDTAVIGNFGSISDIGGIAIGALIFSFLYWGFGFLRMGTTGFVAQADGAGDEAEIRATLARVTLIGLAIALSLLALQWPIRILAFALFDASGEVEASAQSYFAIRIWGAPATLCTFGLLGVLIGLGYSKLLLMVQLLLNGLNIILDVLFAGVLHMGTAGIALGTVIAEWTTLIIAFVLVVQRLQKRQGDAAPFLTKAKLFNREKISTLIAANSDIMIRTLILLFSFAWFTNQSARYGDVVLAANHILLQLISFSAFFLDGYAFVVEAIVGKSLGAGNSEQFTTAVKRSSILAAISALLLALIIWIWGNSFVALITEYDSVRETASSLLFLAALYVFFSFAAFQLDGIFIGASFTREMRNASLISIAVYLLAWWFLAQRFGVAGLWWAMILYVCARADALLLFYPRLKHRVRTAKAG